MLCDYGCRVMEPLAEGSPTLLQRVDFRLHYQLSYNDEVTESFLGNRFKRKKVDDL